MSAPRQYSIASLSLNGRFVSHLECKPEQLDGNLLALGNDFVAIEGTIDPATKRFDVDTQQVVDILDVETDESGKRASVMARILELEQKQARAMREHTLGREGALDRLILIDQEIESLRAYL